MPFQPGQSGNPGGRSKSRPFRDALMMEFASADDPVDVKAGSIRAVARALIMRALNPLDSGAISAIKEIADRIDGKVPQGITGDDEGDAIKMIHRIERVIVRPSDKNG